MSQMLLDDRQAGACAGVARAERKVGGAEFYRDWLGRLMREGGEEKALGAQGMSDWRGVCSVRTG